MEMKPVNGQERQETTVKQTDLLELVSYTCFFVDRNISNISNALLNDTKSY